MSTLRASDRVTSSSRADAQPAKTIVLTHEWRRYAKTRERRARDQLILAYSPIVKYVAGRMVRGMPAHVELADLISYGLGGLIQAVERFEPGRGVKFESYARTRIHGAIVDGIRGMDWVPRHIRDEARRVNAAHLTLSTRLQRMPTDAELAVQLSMDIAELEAALQRMADTRLLALDEAVPADGHADRGTPSRLVDALPDRDAEDPADSAQAEDLRRRIAAAIEQLPERQRIVLGLRYQQEFSLAEIGDVLGVSESRACQLHTLAVRGLRAVLASELAAAAA
jgi:RNA polymerase sigma factor FliA